MADRILVPLDLDHFEVVDTVVTDDLLEVRVRSTFPKACFHCGSTDVVGWGRYERRLRDRSLGRRTVLVWEQARLRCRDCARTCRERNPETLGAKRVTARFASQLADAARFQPWSDVASREGVSWWRVADAFDSWAEALDPTSGPAPRVVSIDEASFRKRFVYHTVLTAPEQQRIVELVEGRAQKSAIEVLNCLPESWLESIETVVIDMFWPFRRAIETILPDARIVADKFHVLRAVDQAAQKVRTRTARHSGTPTSNRRKKPRFDPRIYKSRWVFATRDDRLTPQRKTTLEQISTLHPEIGVAYWLKEAFANIYTAKDRTEAEHRLDTWIHHVRQANITELTRTAETINQWRTQILNYYDDPQTNAYAEGITNKIKVLKRRGYGHTNPHRYRKKVLSLTHQPS